ncbi:MAG: CoA transferase [Candidatus Eisenbacteria bacterium]|nr:CoA transferase [Candidatus Eisenbacteria bacterium]
MPEAPSNQLRPLSGVRVLDLSQILAGPYCTMILADLGCDVVKIELPPEGDRARTIGPGQQGMSAYFASVNRGKRSAVVDWRTAAGAELVRRLAGRTDILVENHRPGVLERAGLGPRELLDRSPRLIYASVTGFGHSGPYRDHPALDIIVQALGGMMSLTGEPGGPPLRPGVSQGDSVAGLFAAVAILASLHQRERTGRGQWIDLAMLDSQVTLLENAFARYFAAGEVPRATGSAHPALTPFQAFGTADGFLVVAILQDDAAGWRRLVELLDLPHLAGDPRFADGKLRTQNAGELIPMLGAAFRKRTTADWIERLSAAGIPCAPVQDVAQAARNPQVRARGMLVDVGGGRTVANTPFRFSAARSGPQGPPPELGAETGGVLAEWLGMDGDEMRRLAEQNVIVTRNDA